MVHPSPSRDFECGYFQRAVFEGLDAAKLPENCVVGRAQSATTSNIVELLQQFPYLSECYSFLRKRLLPSSSAENEGASTESKVQSLVCLGFSRHEALCALNRNHLSIEAAAEWLFDANNRASCEAVDAASYFRHDAVAQRDAAIPAEAKHILAEHAPLEDVVWWYEEVHSAEVEMEVVDRLQTAWSSNEPIFDRHSARSNYGKLMERILAFRYSVALYF